MRVKGGHGLDYDKLAKLYIQEVIRPHGVPANIVSDRDPKFTYKFWRALQQALGTELRLSSSYHPQIDGLTERTIQTLEDLLRVCVMEFGGSWDEHLALIEFIYNNIHHSSINMAPFEALYGRKCIMPLCWFEVGEKSLYAPEIVKETMEKVQIVKERLKSVQDRQRHYANPKRRKIEFQEGEKVWVKVSPMKNVTRFGVNGRLGPRYIGPFEVLERIGQVAYKLALPLAMSHINNVFHVAMLRRCVLEPSQVLKEIPERLGEHLTYEEKPVKNLETQQKKLRNRSLSYVKVHWENHSEREATWELEDDMRKSYPYLFEFGGPNS